MKTILTMPSPELALLTMTGEGKPFVLNRRTMAELEALLDEVRRRAPRALVLTGEGRFFCAGADIREMAAMDGRELYDWALLGSRLNTNLEELPMPVLAAVNGMALGGGCELALACDLRCASMAASFAVPEVTLGTICGAGGTQRLPRLIGETRAKEMIFTGREITAETAREWGLYCRQPAGGNTEPGGGDRPEQPLRCDPRQAERERRTGNAAGGSAGMGTEPLWRMRRKPGPQRGHDGLPGKTAPGIYRGMREERAWQR